MSEFVYVYRKDHDDYMHILEEVQVKYPDKFEVIIEDEVTVSVVEEKKEETPEIEVKKEEAPAKVTRTPTKKK